jgi:type VI secretion system secreted protein VgrG
VATQYRIRSASWTIPPRVVAFHGREGISEIYRFDVGIVWTSEVPFAPEEAVGDQVTLEIVPDSGPAHLWHGVVQEIALVLEEQSSSYWRITFGPRLRTLELTEHSRIFTEVSIPDIVKAVLRDEGLHGGTYAMRTTASYPPRSHVCQYRESSLDFVRRITEREGIFFLFEHDENEDEEQLAFYDESASAPTSLESVRYVGMTAGVMSEGSLAYFRGRRRSLPKSVRLHDYDAMRPRLDVTGRSMVEPGFGGDVVRWGENVKSPDEASRYANIRSQELLSRRDVFEGGGPVLGLRVGSRFNLVEHATLEGQYYVEKLRHRATIGHPSRSVLHAFGFEELIGIGNQYRVDVVALPSSVTYRPTTATPWPRIAGIVTAFVDGPASSPYAQIDDEGRYRTSLHFDEGDTADGSRSTWVRMLQPHAGLPEGMHFPLRKGTEVAVIFLGGDPDRPFIVGATPNPEKPSPVTQTNYTQNVIQTGSLNRVVFEDVAGGQFITWSTPIASSYMHLGAGAKNFVLKTDGRGRIYTGSNYDVDVDVNRTEDVDGDVTEMYQSTQTLSVTGAVTETLRTSLAWGIAGPVTLTWLGPFAETVDGHVSETFNSTLTTTVNAAMTTLTYSGGLRVIVAGDVTEHFTASQSTTVNGPLTLEVGSTVAEHYGSVNRHIKGTYNLNVSGTYKILTPNMVINSPSWNILSNIAKKFISESFKMADVEFKAQWVKSTIGVFSNTINGVSISVTGASATAAGIGKDKGILKKVETGAKAKAVGVHLYSGSIMILKGGIEVET